MPYHLTSAKNFVVRVDIIKQMKTNCSIPALFQLSLVQATTATIPDILQVFFQLILEELKIQPLIVPNVCVKRK